MHSAVKNLWREKPGRGAVFCLICMRFLRITVRLCVYGRYNDRKKYSNEKEGEKEMLPNLFLSKNMIIFSMVGTRNGRAMEALGHEIFICS